eukprot:416867_1
MGADGKVQSNSCTPSRSPTQPRSRSHTQPRSHSPPSQRSQHSSINPTRSHSPQTRSISPERSRSRSHSHVAPSHSRSLSISLLRLKSKSKEAASKSPLSSRERSRSRSRSRSTGFRSRSRSVHSQPSKPQITIKLRSNSPDQQSKSPSKSRSKSPTSNGSNSKRTRSRSRSDESMRSTSPVRSQRSQATKRSRADTNSSHSNNSRKRQSSHSLSPPLPPAKKSRKSTSVTLVKAASVKKSKKGGVTRYFIMKSCSADNLRISQEESIWATQLCNERILNEAYDSSDSVILFFSLNGSHGFQGFAKMISRVENAEYGRWEQKSRGNFGRCLKLSWLIIHHLDFEYVNHLRNEWNDNLPIKRSRDGQELPPKIGRALRELFEKSAVNGDIRVKPLPTAISSNKRQFPRKRTFPPNRTLQSKRTFPGVKPRVDRKTPGFREYSYPSNGGGSKRHRSSNSGSRGSRPHKKPRHSSSRHGDHSPRSYPSESSWSDQNRPRNTNRQFSTHRQSSSQICYFDADRKRSFGRVVSYYD